MGAERGTTESRTVRGNRSRVTTKPEQPAWERHGFLLWHATLRWQREVGAALKPLGLTHVQFVLLSSINALRADGVVPSQADVSAHAGTDAMMTSQVIRALEERGLVVRKSDPTDGRVRRLDATATGRRLADKATRAVAAVDERFFGEQATPSLLGQLRTLAGRDDGAPARTR